MSNYKIEDIFRISSTRSNALRVCNKKGGKHLSEIVVGDNTGSIYFLRPNRKNNTIELTCSRNISQPVGTIQSYNRDAIYISTGSYIEEYNHKGKKVLSFDTNIIDNIQAICVCDELIIAATQYIVSYYNHNIEKEQYISNDVMKFVTFGNLSDTEKIYTFVACQDKSIKILLKSTLIYEIEINSIPNVLCLSTRNIGQLFYGTTKGEIVSLKYENNDIKENWRITENDTLDSIVSMNYYYHAKLDLELIVIGFESGFVRLYHIDDGLPKLILSEYLQESITNVAFAFIKPELKLPQIIASTFSGRIVLIWRNQEIVDINSSQFYIAMEGIDNTKENGSDFEDNNNDANEENTDKIIESRILNQQKLNNIVKAKTEKLKKYNSEVNFNDLKKQYNILINDINTLQKKVDNEKEKLNSILPQSLHLDDQFDLFHIKQRFELDSSEKCYALIIDTDIPIQSIFFKCNFPIVIKKENHSDIIDNDEIGSLKINISSNEREKYSYSGTYICPPNSLKARLQIYPIEGKYGTINIYVVPNTTPPTYQLTSVIVKPLSLHERVRENEIGNINDFTNRFPIKGDLSLSEIQKFISNCFPQVPEKIHEDSSEYVYYFKSIVIDSGVCCKYRVGEIEFSSNNITSLSVIYEILSKKTLSLNKSFETFSLEMDDKLVKPLLLQLYNGLENAINIIEQHDLLIPVLNELSLQENGNISFFDADLLNIMDNHKEIEDNYENMKDIQIKRFIEGITSLYVVQKKCHGISNPSTLNKLIELLEEFKSFNGTKIDWNQLWPFFE
ncbi:hypothetical protein BCR36DRAFT_413548 [Piromyces finnis]|uniref:Uncharacterized protein n=1 Tax=Piromyces finnis TaxID=1754191 RepID=A0A1Y1V6H9_9FUNG|nr:hypothetical protein BCR36DRAFT_413548 [Piromyces finnis]|eukprot:ORX47608.1 hypothetical protein BCR36DRAFT_413548 [Piromyces finnis]